MNIGLLGYGTIGRGVKVIIDNLSKKYDICLTKVFDLPAKKALLGDLLVTDVDEVLLDKSIDLVVEVLGGETFAYQAIKKGLENKKSIVTANKEVVSNHLVELTSVAKANGVMFLYEASVGGGIPIIRNISENVLMNDIFHIYGILNGTTNYILTKMQDDNMSFDEALDLAKANGFAEANPTADLEGLDMVRKINILSSIAFKTEINNENIYHYGITSINSDILNNIKEKGYYLKYVADCSYINSFLSIRVEPVLISNTNPLFGVKNEFNAVFFEGSTNDLLEFYGKGAGSLPTASAIGLDIIAVLGNNDYNTFSFDNKLKVNKEFKSFKAYIVNEEGYFIKENVSESELKNSLFYARIL